MGGEEIDAVCGRPFADPGFAAYGINGEDAADLVTVTGSVTCWRVGDYELTYTLADGEDELCSVTRTVHVVPAELPETVPTEKVIYLTFDDGPCDFTPEVLDILAKYDIKATFFIVAGNHRYTDILPRIVEEGHTLGIHCFSHDYGWLYSKDTVFFEDFMHAQELIYEKTGTYATVSRFPGSSTTASYLFGQMKGGFEELEERMHNMGVRFYDWSVQIEDYNNGAEGTIANFKSLTPKAQIPIVLQHDTRAYSVYSLDKMIEWALSEGYTFAPLDTTVPEVHFY